MLLTLEWNAHFRRELRNINATAEVDESPTFRDRLHALLAEHVQELIAKQVEFLLTGEDGALVFDAHLFTTQPHDGCIDISFALHDRTGNEPFAEGRRDLGEMLVELVGDESTSKKELQLIAAKLRAIADKIEALPGETP